MRCKAKPTHFDRLPYHPILEAATSISDYRYGQHTTPLVIGGISGDAKSRGRLEDFPEFHVKPLSNWLNYRWVAHLKPVVKALSN